MQQTFAVVAVCKPSCRWITFNFKFNLQPVGRTDLGLPHQRALVIRSAGLGRTLSALPLPDKQWTVAGHFPDTRRFPLHAGTCRYCKRPITANMPELR
jgi:hypothetical protein